MWSIHMMEYYSATKKEILTGATWMSLDPRLSERSPDTKGQIMIPLIRGPQSHVHRHSRREVTRGWWRWKGHQCVMAYKYQDRKMKKLQKWMVVMTTHHCEYINAAELYIQEWLEWQVLHFTRPGLLSALLAPIFPSQLDTHQMTSFLPVLARQPA